MRVDTEHTPELYLLGALDDAQREAFETHLAGCRQCLDEATGIGPAVAGLAVATSWAPLPAPAPVRLRSRRRRLATRVGAGVAAGVLVLAGATLAHDRWAARDGVVLTASAQAQAYGVSLSVTVTPGDHGGGTIRLTVTGLREGLRYRLYVVTRDGTTNVVRDWTATAGTQKVSGETPLAPGDLSFVTVGRADGPAIVTAPIAP